MWGVFVPMNLAWGWGGGVGGINLSLHSFMFLGAFSKLLKATISFNISVRPSVCPSVRAEQLGPHYTDFNEI